MEINVYVTRARTGPGDDAADRQVLELTYEPDELRSSLLNDIRNNLPLLENVVWSVWCRDQIIGYLHSECLGGYRYCLPGDQDGPMQELHGDIVFCQYYGTNSFRISAYEKQHDVVFPETPYLDRVIAYEEQMIRDKGAEGFLRPDYYNRDHDGILMKAKKGRINTDEAEEAPVREEDAGKSKFPMKWHKVLMVLMVIGGIYNMLLGILCFFGLHNIGGIESIAVYAYPRYSGLQALDIVCGIVLIAFGICWIMIRNRLNSFRKNAPALLLTAYIGGTVAGVIYLFALAGVLRGTVNIPKLALQIAGYAVTWFIQYKYYAKRKELFVN